jgi:endonuclease YncB( thermonuclease family)
MIRPFERKRPPSRYFSGLVVLCIAIGFVAFQAWPKWFDGLASSSSPSAGSFSPSSVRVIDGDTISLNDVGLTCGLLVLTPQRPAIAHYAKQSVKRAN